MEVREEVAVLPDAATTDTRWRFRVSDGIPRPPVAWACWSSLQSGHIAPCLDVSAGCGAAALARARNECRGVRIQQKVGLIRSYLAA
ncbi:hypothetical protein GCM10017567_56890 [Amycolatopsis bullii]|uniref:Uncharacterized protein n=1 Tax=Amycolatopsis bullii TaxID=941987 RepID=A0ABQ3KSI9_9PSEU|nr:hypothetical protein GCM10017567_56890 [Amycolatopsis bullii]